MVVFSPPFSCVLKGFKIINSYQIMIDDDDNSLIGIATVAFVFCANDGDGSCNKHNVGITTGYILPIGYKSII